MLADSTAAWLVETKPEHGMQAFWLCLVRLSG
jgi:hypothetical protein